jgi:hypothetical protein
MKKEEKHCTNCKSSNCCMLALTCIPYDYRCWESSKPEIKDLTFGTDARGDYALFIEHFHIIGDGWDIDQEVQDAIGSSEPTFFRVLWEGKAQPSHGWIEGAKIVQWG